MLKSMVLYIDAHSGVSGDKILASLVDLFGSPEPLLNLAQEVFGDSKIVSVDNEKSNGMAGLKISFSDSDSLQSRHLSDLVKLLEKSSVDGVAHERSLKAFNLFAEAEAKMHDSVPEKIHFHEASGVDTFMDIVGTALYLDLLNFDALVVSGVNVGEGIFSMQHGSFASPAPATAELLQGFNIYSMPKGSGELTTPTGAVILRAFGFAYGSFPSGTLDRTGYGVGTKVVDGLPNVLRSFSVVSSKSLEADVVIELESNIDDVSPENISLSFERFFEVGALDVFLENIYMKKQRSAFSLRVLTHPEHLEKVRNLFFEEFHVFGVRETIKKRSKLEKREKTVEYKGNKVRLNLGISAERIVACSPEFDDVVLVSKKVGESFLTTNTNLKKICNDIISSEK